MSLIYNNRMMKSKLQKMIESKQKLSKKLNVDKSNNYNSCCDIDFHQWETCDGSC